LLHIPILCSLGCGIYVALVRHGSPHTLAALIACGLASPALLLCSYLMHRLVDAPAIQFSSVLYDRVFSRAIRPRRRISTMHVPAQQPMEEMPVLLAQ
jgi:peptidoglycan/LPS O-acetylase OafA/YrhL